MNITLGDWASLREQALPLRHAVFVMEQHVPVELELDEMDAVSIHALALDAGTAVGTARLLPDGHIGRMAVAAGWRKRGVGTALLLALLDQARRNGVAEVILNAQTHAAGFYARHGFVQRGGEFDDAGIAHVEMARRL